MAPENHDDAPIPRAALTDGIEAAFVLLEKFPHHNQKRRATLEQMDLFHKSTEEQILDLQKRHGAYSIVTLIDGLANIATRYLDATASANKTTRHVLLNRLRANIHDHHETGQHDLG